MEATINGKRSLKYCYFVLIFISIYSFAFTDFWKNWQEETKPFAYDVDQYYSYVPAAFIHKDITFHFKGSERFWLTPSQKEGYKVPKGTFGMAIMYTPFFFIGHKLAYNAQEAQDGYSLGYKLAIHSGCIIYALLGFLFLSFILRRYFSDKVAAITLLLLYFGTNLFHYIVDECEMPHASLFFLMSLYLLLVIKWHEVQKIKYSIGIGLILGLITLIRPSESMAFILFLFVGIKRLSDIKVRFKFLLDHKIHLVIIAVCAFLVVLPQLIYWKYLTGSFFFFSYGAAERFFWDDPKIFGVLFSYRKGWLLYTPIMIFALAGMFVSKRKLPELVFPIVLYFLVYFYLIACWWCWWFGGSFGMRGLIQTYPALALCLAAFIDFILSLSWKRKALVAAAQFTFVALLSAFVCLNQLQTYQYKTGLVHYDGMNEKTYWVSFGKFSLEGPESQEYWTNLTVIDYNAALVGKRDF